jgi:sugar phosphate isomerase/epimerase
MMAATGALAGLTRSGIAQGATLDGGTPSPAAPDKLARISIMSFNFTSQMKLEGQPPGPERTIDLFDIPQLYVDTYGAHNIELQHSHFGSTSTPYLKDLRARVEKTRSRITQINVEFNQMNISAADPVQRDQAIDLTMRWVDHAIVLGCPRVMINQGQLTAASKARSIAALKVMTDYGKSKAVKISVETRGSVFGPAGSVVPTSPESGLPLSEPGGQPAWEMIKDVVEGAGAWSNVDIGGIRAPSQAALHNVIQGLHASNSGNMHVKTNPNWDMGAAIRYLNRELGYKGLYSIEVNPPRIREVYDTVLANL